MNSIEIRKLRKRLGLSQQKFAEKVGVSISTIARWENGLGHPLPVFIEKLNQIKKEVVNATN